MSDSVIHDIGYQRYTGARLGPAHTFRALFSHGLRASFGLGRSAKAKIFPWIAVGIVSVIALIFAIAKSQGEDVGYQNLPSVASVVVLIFLAIVAPELVSRDLRNNLLPLYFSRPLSRASYVGAKVSSLVAAIWLMLAGPQLLIFAAGAFGSGGGVFAEFKGLLGGWAVSAFYAIIYGTLGLLIASLASRRAFAAGAIAAVFLISLPVVGVLIALGNDTLEEISPALSPALLPEGVREAIYAPGDLPIGDFGPFYLAVGILLPAACYLLTLLRYRKVSL
jgi:ABC-2 type transport system permease protein